MKWIRSTINARGVFPPRAIFTRTARRGATSFRSRLRAAARYALAIIELGCFHEQAAGGLVLRHCDALPSSHESVSAAQRHMRAAQARSLTRHASSLTYQRARPWRAESTCHSATPVSAYPLHRAPRSVASRVAARSACTQCRCRALSARNRCTRFLARRSSRRSSTPDKRSPLADA